MSDKENQNAGDENQDINQDMNEQNVEEQDVNEGLAGGDEIDESERIAELLRNSETLSSNSGGDSPLDDASSEPSLEAGADLDEEFSRFVDGMSEDDTELQEKKLAKVKQIRAISLLSLIAVFVLAVGLLSFILINNRNAGFVLTYQAEIDGRMRTQRISVDDFNFLVLTSQSFDPLEDALEFLLTILTIERAANERGLSLTEDELNDVREAAMEARNLITREMPDLDNISQEFLERTYGFYFWVDKLFEVVTAELNIEFDEEEYASLLAEYIDYAKYDYVDAMFKWMMLESAEIANEAKAAIDSGEMTVEEALMAFYYSTGTFAVMRGLDSAEDFLATVGYDTLEDYLDEHGFDMVHLSELRGLGHEHINHLASLQVNQTSEIIEMDGDYLLFIAESVYIPSDEEIELIVAEIYESHMDSQRWEIFMEEFQVWRDEFEVNINQRALDNINLEELFGGF